MAYQVLLCAVVLVLILLASFGRAQERRIASEAVEAPQVYTDRISGSIFYAVYGLVFLFGFGLLLDRMGALRSGVIGLCLAILGGFTAKTFVWIMARRTTIERCDGTICTYSVWARQKGIREPTTCPVCRGAQPAEEVLQDLPWAASADRSRTLGRIVPGVEADENAWVDLERAAPTSVLGGR